MGLIPVGDLEYFFVPRLCHVDYFDFHKVTNVANVAFGTAIKMDTNRLHLSAIQSTFLITHKNGCVYKLHGSSPEKNFIVMAY